MQGTLITGAGPKSMSKSCGVGSTPRWRLSKGMWKMKCLRLCQVRAESGLR